MRRIPVAEIGNGTHLPDGTFSETAFPRQMISHCKRIDPVEDITADPKQAAPLHDPFRGRFLQQHFGIMNHSFRKCFAADRFLRLSQWKEPRLRIDEKAGMCACDFRQHDLFLLWLSRSGDRLYCQPEAE